MPTTLRESYRVQFHTEEFGWLNHRRDAHFSELEPAIERKRELEEKAPNDHRVVKRTLQEEPIE